MKYNITEIKNRMMKTTKRNVILKVKFDYDNSRSLRNIHLLFYDTTRFDKVQTFRTQFVGSIISVEDDLKALKYIRNMK